MAESKDDIVRKIVNAWLAERTALPFNDRLNQIAALLYGHRNDKLAAEDRSLLPKNGLSADDEVMAAVEHYFYARSEVANAEYSAPNMKAFIHVYQWAKRRGWDLRHNPNKPTTPPSLLQKKWAILGADEGRKDLDAWNMRKEAGSADLSPPRFRLPPNFAGKYGNRRLDKVKY